jgi:DNA-binding NtrC family response regulator
MRKILLVENDISVLELFAEVIEKKYSVFKASSYDQALKIIRENAIDMAVVDYRLGDHNGYELIELIKEIKPSLPIIVITAYGNKEMAIKAIRMGVNDFIEKPVKLKQLIEKIDKIFETSEKCPNCIYYSKLVEELRKKIV